MHDLPDFEPKVAEPEHRQPDALVFPFVHRDLLVRPTEGGAQVLEQHEIHGMVEQGALRIVRRQYVGILGTRQVYSLELEPFEPGTDLVLHNLRRLAPMLTVDHFWLAARAVQIVAWDRDHQFCGRCGGPTEASPTERTRRCHHCELSVYPRISPAVIVLVERGDEILLARSPHFYKGVYSTLAGFVEPGETLEHTVAREIREEVGVEVDNIRYFGSQSWPFPNSMMIGFRADYAGGDIVLEEEEIEDAAWFHPGNLPKLPFKFSIARSLIEAFLAERR